MALLKNLNILEEFSCLADRCPNHCCQGFNIDVDEKTFELWNSIIDVNLKDKLVNNIVIKDNAISIKQPPEGACYHMDTNGLCNIHAQLGEEYLSSTCKTYPRLQLKSHIGVSNTAHLSCPEIAHLVLNANRETLFSIQNISDAGLTSAHQADPVLLAIQKILVEYYDKLLQTNNLTLGIWLYDIADTLDYLVRLIKEGKFETSLLVKKCGKSKKIIQTRLDRIKKDIKIYNKSVDTALEIEYWLKIYQLYLSHAIDDFDIKLDKTAVSKLFSNPVISTGMCIGTALKKLNAKLNLVELLNKYTIVKLHNHGFPWRPYQGNYVATLLDVTLPVSILVVLLTLLEASGEDIDTDLVVKLIYKIERKFTHNEVIYEWIQKDPFWLNLATSKSAFLRII